MVDKSTKSSAPFSDSAHRPAAILFDWTGTIAEPAPGRFVDRVAASLGVLSASAIQTDELALSLRQHLWNFPVGGFENAFSAILGELGLSHVDRRTAITQVVEAEFAGQRVYDDARAVLASLRYRGFRTAIVSNLFIPGELVHPALRHLGLANYFDAVVTSADTGHPKPHPSVFYAALARLSTDAADALVCGDTPDTDVAGALSAGLSSVLIDRRARYGDFAAAPVVPTLAALPSILGEGLSPR
jgi:HAD superfamily hydrolase (TIGR01549 family)